MATPNTLGPSRRKKDANKGLIIAENDLFTAGDGIVIEEVKTSSPLSKVKISVDADGVSETLTVSGINTLVFDHGLLVSYT